MIPSSSFSVHPETIFRKPVLTQRTTKEEAENSLCTWPNGDGSALMKTVEVCAGQDGRQL